MRGRLLDRERNEIRVRRKQVNITESEFQIRLIDVVTRVEQSYWDLVAARQDVEVTSQAVALAREQYARNQRMIESGTLAPVEISASKAELERRLDFNFASIGLLTEVENNLKTLLAPNRGATIWGDQLIPTDRTSLDLVPPVDVREGAAKAIAARPELRQLALRMETNNYDQQLARELLKPKMDLVANYINAGLAGAVSNAPNPFTASSVSQVQRINDLSRLAGLAPLEVSNTFGAPPNLIGGYGTALSGVFGGKFQSAVVGVNLDLNLRNRTAQAQDAQVAIQGKRLKLEQTRWEQVIESQVRNAMQAIETAKQRITAANASEGAAKEKFDSETRLFQTGESTNFLVLTRQNEYIDARRRAVVAQLESNKANARLEQALGSTLAVHEIKVR